MEDPASTAKPADNPPALGHPRPPEVVELAHALIHTRQTILPKRLAEPGPDAAQLQAFTRSLAQSYARQVGVDVQEVLALLPQAVVPPQRLEQTRPNQ